MRDRIVNAAREWLGTPYHHQGRLKGVGVDCAWLLIEVYAAAGAIARFDPGPYPADWHLHRSSERYLSFVVDRGREVATPQPGDAVLMRFGRVFSHGAIYVGAGLIVHSYVKRGVHLSDLSEFVQAGRLIKYFDVVNNGRLPE